MKPIIDAAQDMVPYLDLLRARGVRTLIRYYNHRNSKGLPSKRLTRQEALALSDAGFRLAVVFQQGGGRNGAIGELDAAHGRADATQALALADELGQSPGSALYFAVDHDYFRASELRAIEPYFAEVRAALDGRFRVGVYGSGAVGGRMLDRGHADLVWLAGAQGWAGTRELLKTDRWALFQADVDQTEPNAFGYDGNVASPAHPDYGQFTVGLDEEEPGPPEPIARVLMTVRARSGLKLRRTAGEDQPELRTLANGAIVTALGRSGDWILVDVDGDGSADGFMYGKFLETTAGGFPLTPAAGARPLDVALQELALGVAEVPGEASNPRILLYHSHTSLKANSDETAWCSAFVNYCVDTAGLVGTHSAAARSWHDSAWGTDVTASPREGDIVVFSRSGGGAKPGSGHVGFWIEDRGSHVTVLGGNQGNRVKRSVYPKDGDAGPYHYRILSIRRG